MDIDGRRYQVRKFSFFSSGDPCDLRFAHQAAWSGVYEYPFVLAEIGAAKAAQPSIHNCAAGHDDIGLVFKTWLDVRYENAVHSDAAPSTLCRTAVWDIAAPPGEAFHDRFDVVLNVSKLEDTTSDHVEVLKNHLVQLSLGGRFIATFDHPGLQLAAVERFVGEKIVTPPSRLSPRNSRLEDKTLGLPDDHAAGFLVIERVG